MKLSDMWGKSPTYHFNSLHIIMSKVYYRRRIVDIRASIIREKDAKKRDNEYYARAIRNASSTSSKASYRRSKISASASHDSRIESFKRELERAKDALKRCR
jgi:hypothetical protein